MQKYDVIVVGAGFFGAVLARQVKDAGHSVLVLDKRRHVGGNSYSSDFEDTEINVHTYGTHIFHTNDENVWAYVNHFATFNRYRHHVLTLAHGRVYAMPINLGTINQFYDILLEPSEVEAFLESKKTAIAAPANLEEKAISLIGRDLYEVFIKGYTTKQWGCEPRLLPASIITRLPVRHSYNTEYFDDTYQGIPIGGYGRLFDELLKGIPVELGADYFDAAERWRSQCRQLVYSGPLDRYFDYRFGRLGWRSVRFEIERVNMADYQGTSVMNYADIDVPYTRIHEPKHLHPERRAKPDTSVIIREFSHIDDNEPYYPINSSEDAALVGQYRELQRQEAGVLFGGRLAEYKYYDMHQVVASALQKSALVLKSL